VQKYTNFIASTTATNSTLTVLSNASCVVYIAGTLGAATLYSDNGVTPLANPFLSSATGRIDFYAANGRYDVVVSKVGFLSVTISDIELDDLLAPSGSNSVGYLPAGTGAVATTVQTKLREGLSVKDFGATGNGVTDDTVAIQLAFTSAAALTPKKTVYFPAGTYVINPSTLIDPTGCSIDGDGQNVSIIKPSVLVVPAVAGLYTHFVYNTDSNFTVSNIQIDLTNVTYLGASVSLAQRSAHILVFNCTNWAIRNCSFIGISNNMIGVYGNGGNYWEVVDCYFENLVPSDRYTQSINIQENSGKHKVLGNVMNGCGLFSASGEGLVSNNICYNIAYGAGLAFGPEPTAKNNVITNNHCTGGFGFDENSTYTSGIENWTDDAIITGNYMSNNAGSGISHGGQNGLVANNICLNNGNYSGAFPPATPANGITAFSILSPYVSNPANSVITGNICSDTQATKTQGYGYRESGTLAGFTGMMVHSNYFYGNLTGDQLLVQTLPQVLRSNSPAWMPSMSVGSATPATNVNLLSNSFQSLTGVDASALRVIDSFTSTATSGNRGINFQMSTAAAVTNVTPVFINNTTTTGAGAITNQTGIFIQDLTTGTNIKAIQTNVAAGANKYNIFASGTAPNYFAGEVQIAGGATPILHSITAQNNGAGVAAGTVTNAPVAGNPTKWIAFDDAGVTRYIPAW
jgi:hypothetical protein